MLKKELICFSWNRLKSVHTAITDVTKIMNGEWGMGNGEWGMGIGEWGMRNNGQR